jgi:actin related protein 2/3 complex subunit 2
MILLEPGNRILGETVSANVLSEEEKVEPCDVRLCDFDDVSYRIQVAPETRELMKVSMNLPCYTQIKDKGAEAALKAKFGDKIGTAEVGFDITLDVPLGKDQPNREETVKSVSLLKPIVVGGVFDHYFQALLDDKDPEEPFKFDLRGDTSVFIFPGKDRVVVVFSMDFGEHVDKVIAKVFMQEFVDAKRRIGRAPPVTWGANPPRELEHYGIKENQGNLGFISFAVLKSHLDKGKKDNVIQVLQVFRNYIQYHIKCSKSYFHSRMRARVRALVKVLNRAKFTEAEMGGNSKKAMKTASGKTFKRG